MNPDRKQVLLEAKVSIQKTLMEIELKHGLHILDVVPILKEIQDELMEQLENRYVRIGTAAALIGMKS